MTDKELTRLAALAYGIENLRWHEYYKSFVYVKPGGSTYQTWDPLSSCVDAFRLAMKLNIDIKFDPTAKATSAICYLRRKEELKQITVTWEDGVDKHYSTCFAITNAAAYIAMDMKQEAL